MYDAVQVRSYGNIADKVKLLHLESMMQSNPDEQVKKLEEAVRLSQKAVLEDAGHSEWITADSQALLVLCLAERLVTESGESIITQSLHASSCSASEN